MEPKPAVYLVMMTLLWQLSGLVKSAVVVFFCWQPIQIFFCLLSSSIDFSSMFLLNVLLILFSKNANLTY
jgi:hypothetical protein